MTVFVNSVIFGFVCLFVVVVVVVFLLRLCGRFAIIGKFVDKTNHLHGAGSGNNANHWAVIRV